MFVDFEKMPLNSRVWIYQTNRLLTANENNKAAYFLKNEIEKWAAHGTNLHASFKIEHDRFVVIALDESQSLPSGCSIDASTHWLKELGAQFNIDFFDRSLSYIENKEIKSASVFELKKTIEAGNIHSDTIVFDNTITRLQELISHWKITASNYKFTTKYFNAIAV